MRAMPKSIIKPQPKTASITDAYAVFKIKKAARKIMAAVKWKVCPKCEGHGKVMNNAFQGQWDEDSVYDMQNETGDALDQMMDSYIDQHGEEPTPEALADMKERASEAYLEKLMVTCPKCQGKRVIEDSPEQEERDADQDEWDAEIRNEERMLGNRDYM